MRRNTPSLSCKQITLCGVFSALSLAFMLIGSLLPAVTYTMPAFSGFLLLIPTLEYGIKSGLTVYGCVCILALLLCPDKEMACMFLCFFGYYPLVKLFLEKIRWAVIRWATKLLLFNSSILVMYAVLLFVFPLPALRADFEQARTVFLLALWLAGNVTFLLYDRLVANAAGLYCIRIRPRLQKLLRL